MKNSKKILGIVWFIIYFSIIGSAISIFILYPQNPKIVNLVWTWIIVIPLAVNFIISYIIGKDKKDILNNDFKHGLTGLFLFIFLTFVLIMIIKDEFYYK